MRTGYTTGKHTGGGGLFGGVGGVGGGRRGGGGGGGGDGGGIPGLEAARLRLLRAREELEYRLVEAAVTASIAAGDAGAPESAPTVANRDALMRP